LPHGVEPPQAASRTTHQAYPTSSRGSRGDERRLRRGSGCGTTGDGPSNAGSTNSVHSTVAASEIVSSLPISAEPGSGDSARLPNAVIVVSALNTTARAVLDCRWSLSPARQFITK